MKRRILCVLIALALCLGLCPGGAFMAGAVSGTLDFQPSQRHSGRWLLMGGRYPYAYPDQLHPDGFR